MKSGETEPVVEDRQSWVSSIKSDTPMKLKLSRINNSVVSDDLPNQFKA